MRAGAQDTLGRQLQRAAAWRTAGFLCLSVSSYLVTVILARSFGPAVYGVYGIVYGVLASVELLLRLGVPQAMVRAMGADLSGGRHHEASGATLIILLNLVAFIALWIAAPYLAELLNIVDGARLLRLAFLDIPVFCVFLAFTNVRLGRFEYMPVGLATGLYGVARLAGVGLLAATDTLSLEAALVVNIVASLVGVIVVISGRAFRPAAPSLSMAGPLLAAALPIALGEIGTEALIAIDLWMLNAVDSGVSADLKGWYVAALSLARAPNLMAFVLVSVLVQSLSRAIATNQVDDIRSLVTGCVRILLVVLLPACVLIAVNSREILSIMFSEGYADGGRFLSLLVLSHGLFLTSMMVFQSMLVGGDHAGRGAWRIYIGLLAAAVSSYLLISTYGGRAAGIGPVLSFALSAGLVATAVYRRFGFFSSTRNVCLSIVLSGGVAIVSHMIEAGGAWFLVEICGLGVAYLIAAWRLGLILPTDIEWLRRKAPASADSLQQ